MTSNKLNIALVLTGAAGSFAVGGGERAGHNTYQNLSFTRGFWAVRFLFCPRCHLGSCPGAWLGVLPCILQSPGHVAGAGEGVCNCWWTCLTAGQATSSRAGVSRQRALQGRRGSQGGRGVFWAPWQMLDEAKRCWRLALETKCYPGYLAEGRLCGLASPLSDVLVCPQGDELSAHTLLLCPMCPWRLGTGAGPSEHHGGPPGKLVVMGTLALVWGSSTVTHAWKYQ